MSIRMASKVALKSTYKQHRLGAVVVKGGRILATGYNQLRPSKLIGTATLHAEAAAILELLKNQRQHDAVGADIYVSRWTRGGRIGMAKPCDQCMSLLRSVGISTVYFTTDKQVTEKMRLN